MRSKIVQDLGSRRREIKRKNRHCWIWRDISEIMDGARNRVIRCRSCIIAGQLLYTRGHKSDILQRTTSPSSHSKFRRMVVMPIEVFVTSTHSSVFAPISLASSFRALMSKGW